MAETVKEGDPSTIDVQSRESSAAFEPPSYKISYASDHTIQWDPAQGSRELAIALSYHFPMERDLESKMRAATKKFLKAEVKRDSSSRDSFRQIPEGAMARAEERRPGVERV
jgi:hypothetical protein